MHASDSDYDKEISEYVKEEKKRKQMEAVAEDLFNTEKVNYLFCCCKFSGKVKQTGGK